MFPVPLSVLDLSTVRAGGTSADALADTFTLAQAADRLGLERFWVAEHHNMPSVAATTPPVLIAAVAARTERIRVGSGGVMLPNHSPYVIAEQFAALEAMHPGRIDLGIGRAPGADQITAWALRRTQEGLGHEEFDEHLRLVRAWLSPSGVRTGLGTTLTATPAASSYPDLWLLGSSDYSARLAGRLGLRYCYAGHFGQLDPAAVIALYRDAFVPSADLAEPYPMVCTSVITAPTPEEADWLAGPAKVMWLGLRTGRLEPIVTPEEAAHRLAAHDAASLVATKYVGTPDAVREGLAELVADAGLAELMVTATAHDVATRVAMLESLAA
ncbi:LLM class flavin-dependent oxidoreductase [Propioniciclava soli]|uniref:LLM class flavin-dependent oxidoreductase n=1 Tax=Propioniciclava soli TaxID=2775081 RepID=UPI001E332CA3|nr:LLM class flavin-dependent oxidoreductase [Propioniciclava soli]